MVKLIPHITGAILVLVLLLKYPSNSALTSYYFAVQVGLYAGIVLWLYRLNPWASAFLALSVGSVLFFGGHAGQLGYLRIYAVWFIFVAVFVPKKEVLLRYFGFILLFHVALMALQVFYGDPWARDVYTLGPLRVPTGLVQDINASSALIAICFPAAVFGSKNLWTKLLFAAATVFGLIMVKAFIGVLAVLVSSVAYLFFIRKDKQAVFCAAAMGGLSCLYWIFIDSPGVSVRKDIWLNTAEKYFMNWKNLIFGGGLGRYAVTVSVPGNEKFLEHYAHNELIHYTAEIGIGAVIVFIGWAATNIIFTNSNPVYRAGLVASVCTSMAYFAFHNPLIALLMTTWAAMDVKNEEA
ncbi:MAG TPA: hypothetical protein DDY86_09315 [Syntrophaceae bacterium]|nr:hypothetical protein [Syntrophaceae bacterium]